MDYSQYKIKYLKYKKKYLKLKSLENKQLKYNLNGGSDKNTLYLFKAEWCGHCKGFKPTWEKLQNEMKDKVNFKTYDSDKDADMIEKFKIQGFPTLVLKVGDKAIEYVGGRDILSLKDFINLYSNNLNNTQ